MQSQFMKKGGSYYPTQQLLEAECIVRAWCRGMGRVGRDWAPVLSIYNTGYAAYIATNIHPARSGDFKRSQIWNRLRFQKYSPMIVPNPEARKVAGVEIRNFGHVPYLKSLNLGISYEDHWTITIPQKHLLHMVVGMDGSAFCLQFSILPYFQVFQPIDAGFLKS